MLSRLCIVVRALSLGPVLFSFSFRNENGCQDDRRPGGCSPVRSAMGEGEEQWERQPDGAESRSKCSCSCLKLYDYIISKLCYPFYLFIDCQQIFQFTSFDKRLLGGWVGVSGILIGTSRNAIIRGLGVFIFKHFRQRRLHRVLDIFEGHSKDTAGS